MQASPRLQYLLRLTLTSIVWRCHSPWVSLAPSSAWPEPARLVFRCGIPLPLLARSAHVLPSAQIASSPSPEEIDIGALWACLLPALSLATFQERETYIAFRRLELVGVASAPPSPEPTVSSLESVEGSSFASKALPCFKRVPAFSRSSLSARKALPSHVTKRVDCASPVPSATLSRAPRA